MRIRFSVNPYQSKPGVITSLLNLRDAVGASATYCAGSWGGAMYLEVPEEQAETCREIMQENGIVIIEEIQVR